ncbi:DUF2000 domain-containing protein [Herbiconiux sp. P15]|uniref:DUF2000 domain-containing protein n=1 Tax=Herbiconiux liukaitaii TaxID=3342799 RepID=UPI0035B8D63A
MQTTPESEPIGFAPHEIDTAASTRAARLKWVVVVNDSLPPGRALNAAVCVSAATVSGVRGLMGPPTLDADGMEHPGLPWIGCTVLVADDATLRTLRRKAEAHEGTFVADMPAVAQEIRVYDEYVAAITGAAPDEVQYLAVSLVGPKNRIAKLVDGLPLMP